MKTVINFFIKQRIKGAIKDLKLKMNEYHNCGNEERAGQCYQEIVRLYSELQKYD